MKRWIGFGLTFALISSLFGSVSAKDPVSSPPKSNVQTGLDVILSDPDQLKGKKVGLITNPTGMSRDYRHGLDAMMDKGIHVVKVYGPEHGVRGVEQAGETPDSYIDPRSGLPFVNLYGKKPKEMAPLFDGVDILVFDIQDVGTRFYTYIYTMAYAMEAANMADKPFMVLDRPNPIGGEKVEGPVLDPDEASFVGLFPIPQRHGMTIGELALLFNGEFLSKKTDLKVVPLKGWKRWKSYDAHKLPWVMPSPNMPTLETALVYPGTGMFEGTNLSEGRGTTKPFQLVGAPYIKGWELTESLNSRGLPGVSFREAYFVPTFSKYKGKQVGGVEVHVEDPQTFSPVLTGVAMIQEVKRLYPEQFAWHKEGQSYWIDKLTGSDRLRKQIDEGVPTYRIEAGWKKDLAAFMEIRKNYLIYPEKK
nr:DUF1343 domain-containing protein [Kroppenstedtia pulmonis]